LREDLVVLLPALGGGVPFDLDLEALVVAQQLGHVVEDGEGGGLEDGLVREELDLLFHLQLVRLEDHLADGDHRTGRAGRGCRGSDRQCGGSGRGGRRRLHQATPELEAEADDEGLRIIVLVAAAVSLEDLQVADEGSEEGLALHAEGNRDAGGQRESGAIEPAGAHVEDVAVEPGLGAPELFGRVRLAEAQRLRFARRLDAEADARGPGRAAAGSEARLRRHADEGQAGREAGPAVIGSDDPFDRAGAAELEPVGLRAVDGESEARLDLHPDFGCARGQGESQQDGSEELRHDPGAAEPRQRESEHGISTCGRASVASRCLHPRST